MLSNLPTCVINNMTSGKDVCKHLNPVCTREGVAVAQGMPGKCVPTDGIRQDAA